LPQAAPWTWLATKPKETLLLYTFGTIELHVVAEPPLHTL